MKILLAIEPGDIGNDQYLTFSRWAICNDKDTDYGIYPFRMAYTSALLERDIKDIQIDFMDPFINRMSTQDFINKTISTDPDIIMLQISPILWEKTKKVINTIKEKTKALVIVCGNYPSAEPETCLSECPSIDIAMIGEYMETAKELVILKKENKNYKDLKGLASRNGSQIQNNGPRELMDINKLPWPDRKRIDPAKYRNFTIYHPTYYMLMSMGCPCSCIFCVERHIMYKSNCYRFRNPKDIVDEMEYLEKEMGAKQIWFDDDTATADHDSIMAFCEEKIKRNVKIPYGLMGDLIFSNEEVIKALAKSGCISYAFGVESANPEVLKKIGKPVKLDKIKSGVKLLRKYGLISHGTFTFGHPGETRESMLETFNFAKTLKCDNAQFAIATPYPGTPFYKLAKKNDWIAEKDLSKYFGNVNSIVSYPQLPKAEIETMVSNFNKQWEKISARKRFMIAFRHPLLGLAKLKHEGLKGAFYWLKKALF